MYRTRADWSKEGKCSQLPPEETDDKFFPGRGRPPKITDYSPICEQCPVMIECLNWAVVHRPVGVWGNMSQAERERLPQKFRGHLVKVAHSEGWLESELIQDSSYWTNPYAGTEYQFDFELDDLEIEAPVYTTPTRHRRLELEYYEPTPDDLRLIEQTEQPEKELTEAHLPIARAEAS